MGLFSSKEDKELIKNLLSQTQQQQDTIDSLTKHIELLNQNLKDAKNNPTNDSELSRLKDLETKQQKEIQRLNSIVDNKNQEVQSLQGQLNREKQELTGLQNQLNDKQSSTRKQDLEFFGIEGNYMVGRDIPVGGYVFKRKSFKTSAFVSLYPSYNKFKKEEDEIIYQSFENEYYVFLDTEKTYLQVENADIYLKKGASFFKILFTEEVRRLKDELDILNNDVIAKYYTFSDYENISSEECKNKLLLLKQREKELRKSNKDVSIEASNEELRVFERAIRSMLRTFNSECDNILFNISLKNIDICKRKIQQSYETLNKLYEADKISISKKLLELKLEQATLMYTYELKYQQEKDIQKAIKEQMLDDARAEREIEEQKKKIEKDLQQHMGEINRLTKYMHNTQFEAEKQHYMEKIKELEEKIKSLESDKATVLEREANAKAGFVYIISNIGSFGENIYKIGMTRRLEPMDRIAELSSASVPFEFDVHAMIFSSDAPELENMLHKHFADKAVNKVNPRKEFYNVDIDEIEKVVKKNYNNTVQFTKIPVAAEYRQSINMQ